MLTVLCKCPTPNWYNWAVGPEPAIDEVNTGRSAIKIRVLFVPIVLTLMAAVALAGCGMAKIASGESAPASAAQSSPTVELTEKQQESISGCEDMTPDQKCAALEALRHAEDANPGSVFHADKVSVADGWAHVLVQEADVPDEEAVGFGVYLRMGEGGTWEVAETGTSVSPEDLPGAPLEIFRD